MKLTADEYLRRAIELERLAETNADDIAYCLTWAGVHRQMAQLVADRDE